MVGADLEDVDGLDVVVDVLGAVGVTRLLAAVELELTLAAGGALAVQEGVAYGDVEGEVDLGSLGG